MPRIISLFHEFQPPPGRRRSRINSRVGERDGVGKKPFQPQVRGRSRFIFLRGQKPFHLNSTSLFLSRPLIISIKLPMLPKRVLNPIQFDSHPIHSCSPTFCVGQLVVLRLPVLYAHASRSWPWFSPLSLFLKSRR